MCTWSRVESVDVACSTDDVGVPKRWAWDERGNTMADATKSDNVDDARDQAVTALYDVITDGVAAIRKSEYSLLRHTGRIKDLANAFRLIDGGPQAGGVEVEVSK